MTARQYAECVSDTERSSEIATARRLLSSRRGEREIYLVDFTQAARDSVDFARGAAGDAQCAHRTPTRTYVFFGFVERRHGTTRVTRDGGG